MVWTDGTDMYYSYDSKQYKLNKSTSTWEQFTWNGLTSFNGNRVWTDGTDVYFSEGASSQYRLDKETSTWEPVTWNGQTGLYGNHIWTDGTDVYSSDSSNQYKLNKETSTWEQFTWNGLTRLWSSQIWTDGTNVYSSGGSASDQYKLNRETSTWEQFTWNGLTTLSGSYIWTNGTDVYTSGDGDYYKLNKETSTWEPLNAVMVRQSFNMNNIWTDGTDIYYDDGFKLNKDTNAWERFTWNGLTDLPSEGFKGKNVWTDGPDTYFSYGGVKYDLSYSFQNYVRYHYKLDKATHTWESIDFGSDANFSGTDVWTNGTDLFANAVYDVASPNVNGPKWRKFVSVAYNKETGKWVSKSWSNIPSETTTYESSYVLRGSSVLHTQFFTIASFWKSNVSYYYMLDKSNNSWIAVTGVPSESIGMCWDSNNAELYLQKNNTLKYKLHKYYDEIPKVRF